MNRLKKITRHSHPSSDPSNLTEEIVKNSLPHPIISISVVDLAAVTVSEKILIETEMDGGIIAIDSIAIIVITVIGITVVTLALKQ
jgi:hypothetical protein